MARTDPVGLKPMQTIAKESYEITDSLTLKQPRSEPLELGRVPRVTKSRSNIKLKVQYSISVRIS